MSGFVELYNCKLYYLKREAENILSYKAFDKRIIFFVLAVIVSSQFNLNLLAPGFIITVVGIIMPLFFYAYEGLNPLLAGFASGVASPLVRFLILYEQNNDFLKSYNFVIPDVLFYFTYGAVFYFIYFKCPVKNLNRFIIAVFFSDFLANMSDLCIRTGMANMTLSVPKILMTVAFIRTIAVGAILLCMRYYKLLLKKEEHEKRYRNLVLLTSYFKSEIFFMNKNISEIEDVMKKAYNIYKLTLERDDTEDLRDLALCISKDVHEIKKDYLRVIQGIEQLSKDNTVIADMNIKDIINILEIDTNEYIKRNSLDINIDFNVYANFMVKENYYMMSVISNLIYNSIDALRNRENGTIRLSVHENKNDSVYTIDVYDNGSGIKESNLDYIFNPSFSTKFDSATGDINRGIGLTLVKDLVEGYYHGTIKVTSVENKGTTFNLRFPAGAFKACRY